MDGTAARRAGAALSAALCLSLACGIFAPTKAHASCGDWLAGHEHEEARAQEPAGREAIPAPSPRKPCSGPTCSRRPPAAPLAPVDSSFDRGIERWCSLTPCVPHDSFRVAGVVPADDPALPPARSRRLDRPPKAARSG